MGSASLYGSASYGAGASAAPAAAQSHDDVTVLLTELLGEIRSLRAELGPTIADYAPSFPTERQAKRKVQEWTR